MKRAWRSLLEAEQDPEFLARAQAEFPRLAEALALPATRRRALKLMAASMALAGLSSCASPGTPFNQFVVSPVAPPNIIPGKPNYYTSVSLFGPDVVGVVVKHVMGRPLQVEGNPNHPASLGAVDIHAIASLLDFYDPYRSSSITNNTLPQDRQALELAMLDERARLAARKGEGFRILTPSLVSPTLALQIAALLLRYPQARWHQWDPISRESVRQGAVLAYGRPLEMIPHPGKADVILGLDSDMLSTAPGHIRLAREYAQRRNPVREVMNRVFAADSTPGLLGVAADHHFNPGPAEMRSLIGALAAMVLHNESASGAPAWLPAVAQELKAAQGRALVHLGPDHPAEAHALVHAVNEALGGRGTTFDLIEGPAYATVDPSQLLPALAADMQAGKVDSLLVLGTNPLFTASPELGFSEGLKRVRFSLYMAETPDETAQHVTWFVPEAHVFERWSDARAFDGTASIIQPQSLPLYGGISAHEVVNLYATPFPKAPRTLVRESWATVMGTGANFEESWRAALASGVIAGTALPPLQAKLLPAAAGLALPALPAQPVHLVFRPDPNLWDGRYANNVWLQELPRPLTKITWDNPLLVSAKLAADMKLQSGDMVELAVGGATVAAPVWVNPGQAPDTVTALLGYGRRVTGPVGEAGTGFDFFPLRGAAGAPQLRRIGKTFQLASTDHHDVMSEHPGEILRHGTLADFQNNHRFLRQREQVPDVSIYANRPKYSAQAWGMGVDLNACIGCNACVLACVMENNIPMVGKQQVTHEREMFWLRIDRYYSGPIEQPDTYFQPMFCQHCEEAPCEVVCPVEATLHDDEGINLQVYNRCIGTRFCSNNCPYKVRRFNFYPYQNWEDRDFDRPQISRNPDVSARARGVMEKCTFCIQRVEGARIKADKENRPIGPGEVVTACQAACPTRAYAFGNINDPIQEVSQRKQSPLNYAVLETAATHPRVTYEGHISNPNPAIPNGVA